MDTEIINGGPFQLWYLNLPDQSLNLAIILPPSPPSLNTLPTSSPHHLPPSTPSLNTLPTSSPQHPPYLQPSTPSPPPSHHLSSSPHHPPSISAFAFAVCKFHNTATGHGGTHVLCNLLAVNKSCSSPSLVVFKVSTVFVSAVVKVLYVKGTFI